jgi:bacterioferritin (cytochrome b1)
MRHAESIAERIVQLGGESVLLPVKYDMGETAKEMLEIDKAQESGAIALYKQI